MESRLKLGISGILDQHVTEVFLSQRMEGKSGTVDRILSVDPDPAIDTLLRVAEEMDHPGTQAFSIKRVLGVSSSNATYFLLMVLLVSVYVVLLGSHGLRLVTMPSEFQPEDASWLAIEAFFLCFGLWSARRSYRLGKSFLAADQARVFCNAPVSYSLLMALVEAYGLQMDERSKQAILSDFSMGKPVNILRIYESLLFTPLADNEFSIPFD